MNLNINSSTMIMNRFPFINPALALAVFRVVVSLILVLHGVMRLWVGTVNDFGQFLSSQGFMAGSELAWFLTIFEVIGGITMAAGYFIPWIAAIFILEILMGIILVHARHGWFVVGHQLNGVEFSVLLIFSLLVIAATRRS